MGTLSPYLNRHGNKLLSLCEQPGGEMQLTAYGIAYYNCQYVCDRDLCYKLAPLQYEPHPRFPTMGNMLEKTRITERETDAVINCIYAGFTNVNIPQYEVITNLNSAGITTHPNFSSPELGGTAAAPGAGGCAVYGLNNLFLGFTPTPNGQPGPKFPLAGTKSYLTPGTVIRITWAVRNTIYDLSCVGKIVNPPGDWFADTGWEDADPGGTFAQPNWLCTGFNQRIQGLVNQVVFDFRLSGFAGWSTLLYQVGSLPVSIPPPVI